MDGTDRHLNEQGEAGILIDSLLLKNVACFSDITIPFKKRTTVLVGVNGVGKTTILTSILACFIAQEWDANKKEGKQILPMTREKENQAEIKLLSKKAARHCQIIYSKNTPFGAINIDFNCERDFDPRIGRKFFIKIPLVFLPAFRRVTDKVISGVSREGPPIPETVMAWMKKDPDYSQDQAENFKQWIVNRYFFRREEWGDKYVKQLQLLIDIANQIFGEEKQITLDKVNEKMEPIFSTKTGKVPLGSLPSGVHAIFQCIWKIYEQFEAFYPDSTSPEKEPGLVLIDELDAHLHPEWQQTILNVFRDSFPHTQLIISTHSPLIVSGCEKDEAVFLKFEEGSANVIIDNTINNPKGWLADRLLTSVFGLKYTRDKEWAENIEKVKNLIANRYVKPLSKKDIKFLKEMSQDLQLPSSDPAALLLDPQKLKEIIKEKNA